MIIITCTDISIIFEDTCCGGKEEIFPPFRMYQFADGATVIGADSKSFYIPKNTTYTIDDVSYTYEEVLAELALKFVAIEGSNEVQCYADLASFPASGEECSIYIAEDTNLIYRWNGSAYVELSVSMEMYQAVVAADGTGDYLLLSEAEADGATSVFVRNGNYVETGSVDLSNLKNIKGESTEGVKIILTGGFSLNTPVQAEHTDGTITIASDTTTVTGVASNFTPDMVGKYVKLGEEWYKIDNYTSPTVVDIEDKFRGDDLAGTSYAIQAMTTGVQLNDFSVIGTDGVTVNSSTLVDLNAVLFSQLENIYGKTSDDDIIKITKSSNVAMNHVIGKDGGNGGGVGVGSGIEISGSSTIRMSICNFSNNNNNGVTCVGCSSTSIVGTNMNNNGTNGVELTSTTAGAYTLTGNTIEGNDTKGIFSEIDTDEVTLTGNLVRFNGSDGVELSGEGNAVSSNIISNNDINGLRVNAGTTVIGNQIRNNSANKAMRIEGNDCVIIGNIIEDNLAGIYVDAKNNTTVTGNIIRNNGNSGVECFGACDSTSISGNTILNSTSYGIRISATLTKTKILTNTVTGSGVADYLDSATDTAYLVLHDGGISNYTSIDSVAALDIQSTTKGVLLPRMTAAQASAIIAVEGLVLFVTSTDATFTAVGYWEYASGAWHKLGNVTTTPIEKTNADSPYSATAGEIIVFDCTTADSIINFPTAVGNAGKEIAVKRKDTTLNNLTINPNGVEKLDFDEDEVIIAGGGPAKTGIIFVSDGTTWYIKV